MELGLPASAGPGESPEQRGRRVLGELMRRSDENGGNGACLLILDNVSEPQLLAAPQLALIPHEKWLRIVATTRLGRSDLHGRELAFIPVDSLTEDAAVELIKEHQSDGDWPVATKIADEAGARDLVRELGGYTLAVEAVAIYLGLHQEIRPGAYLARLRKEGLPSVDELVENHDVAAQMQHRDKQLAMVLELTLQNLSPVELTALEYAALLAPDSIPWSWLRTLVGMEDGDALRHEEGYPDPWVGVRRRLEGTRLLTPGDRPEIARLHRLVSAHMLKRMGEKYQLLRSRLDDLLHAICGDFERRWEHDPGILWLLQPLQDSILHLAARGNDLRLAKYAGIVGTIEHTQGRLDKAQLFLELYLKITEQAVQENTQNFEALRNLSIALKLMADFLASRGQPGDAEQALGHFRRSLEVAELLLAANPESAQAARDVSVSLNKLADFLASRGQPGDAEQALGHYLRSLEVAERLLAANPESAQAARDVSVSLNMLADFLASRGQPGDAEQALEYYDRDLEISERLLAANPESAQAARDVSVSLDKLADFLARRGQPGDAEQAWGHYRRSLEVRERLLAANPESAQAARDVWVSLNKLADVLASRGQPGDAEQALEHYDRALKISGRLLAANPESAQAARDVSISLERLADFLARRGQPGDAEQALDHYRRSLEVRERLLTANPESAEAARDVLISLERLARGEKEGVESRKAALEYQMRSLEIAKGLRERNPGSVFYGRTAAISAYFAAQRAMAADEMELAGSCLSDCHAILHDLVTAGVELDAPMVRLYEQLSSESFPGTQPPVG